MDDERKGWTSASNARYDALCPGRHLAQRDIAQVSGSDAEFGSEIHAALASGKTEGLSNDQLDIYESCQSIEEQLVQKVFGPDAPNVKSFKEQRYWCQVRHNDNNVLRYYMHSGRVDKIHRAGQVGLIVEYKTLAGEQQGVDEHAQLRDQAVLAARNLILKEVACAVVQPLVTHDPEVVLYDAASIDQAEKEMFERVIASNNPKALRIPGAVQCKFCAAKNYCQDYAKWAVGNMPAPLSMFDVPVTQWTPEQRTIFCERYAIVEKWINDNKEAIKKMLKEDPDAVPGFGLKPGAVRQVVTDPQELFNRFAMLGGNLDQFMVAVTIVKEKLEAQIRAVTQTKGKGLKAKVDEVLSGITETHQNESSIVKVK